MSFLLDTNICSAHLRRPSGLAHQFLQYSGRLFIPTVVVGELYAWAYRRPDPLPILTAINNLLIDMQILDFDRSCAEVFGRLRGQLLNTGISVPGVDLMIAATTLVHNLTLVTHNLRDFAQIPSLQIVD